MNPEKLHDALNLLDDELILEVELLRRRKGFRWQHLGTLAACLVLVCALGIYGLFLHGGSTELVPEQNLEAEMAVEDGLPERVDLQPGKKDGEELFAMPGVDTVESDKNMVKMETMLVEVTKLEEDRFTATVLQSDRFYSAGETVTIHLTALTRLIEGKDAYPIPEGEQAFLEGAVLVVDYSLGQDKKTVIAECITFGE